MPSKLTNLLRYGLLPMSLTIYLGLGFTSDDRRKFVPGDTTSGHHQIEIACDSCHTPFLGVRDDACLECHGDALARSDDSHPKAKFLDPRNANRLEKLDARRCVTCHLEHRPELTRAFGVTQPSDYCHHCHHDIGSERESHAALGFDTCQDAGCHNYHDNRSLHEEFLVDRLGQPEVLANPIVALREPKLPSDDPAIAPDAPSGLNAERQTRDWLETAHAAAGVNCSGCHQPAPNASSATTAGLAGTSEEKQTWNEQVDSRICGDCHEHAWRGFLAGKHGMRVAVDLPPMRPALARIPMRPEPGNHEIQCTSCHSAHRFSTSTAAVDACQTCHDDTHSRAYARSPHAALWEAERDGTAPAGSGVSCATCHLPRRQRGDRVVVEHNQNANLRPPDKMLRDVCITCHGIPFALSALSDPELVDQNFRGRPTRLHESIDMVWRRELAHTESQP